MKLQHITVIFIIIILPIILVLSYYIQTQITTATLRDNYKTALIDSTHDAMTAYELNSMNNDYNEDANSKKRDVQASINTFFTSLANNFGVPGYADEYIEPYIPAIVFTGYDGYYIYARTTEVNRYTKKDEDAGRREEGDIIDGNTSTDYNLKPYIYYSAQYRNDTGTIDVVINYTLDNYITVYGTINGNYCAKSGYLLGDELTDISSENLENLSENVTCKIKYGNGNSAKDVYFEKKDCPYFYTYNFQSKSFEKVYYINDNEFEVIDPDNLTIKKTKHISDTDGLEDIKVIGENYLSENTMYFKITSAGYFSQIDASQITEDKTDAEKDNRKVLQITNFANWYNGSNIFSDSDIKAALETLQVNDMLVLDSDGKKVRVAELDDDKDKENAYFKFKKNEKNIFDTGNQFTYFDTHRQDVIKISIQENLKSALANYQSGTYTYKLPMLTDTDWDKIFSNISMIAFIEDLPVKYTTLTDYVIATSTGNKEYIPDDGIYFIAKETNTYHRINCQTLANQIENGKVDATKLVGYKAMEFERNSVKIDGKEGQQNYYPHDATACYDCIISSNYTSLYNDNGILTITDPDLKKLYYSALARERVTQYKATKYLSSY